MLIVLGLLSRCSEWILNIEPHLSSKASGFTLTLLNASTSVGDGWFALIIDGVLLANVSEAKCTFELALASGLTGMVLCTIARV